MTNIYFAQSGRQLKIGRADDVASRLVQLQTGNPHPLVLLAIIKDVPLAVERYLHQAFSAQRTHGEWFFFDIGLRCFVAHIQGGAKPTTPVEIAYYRDLVPDVRASVKPHIDVRLTARFYEIPGEGARSWPQLRAALLRRGDGYSEAVCSFEKRHGLTGGKSVR